MCDRRQLSEEDIKLRYITPSILAKGWSVTDITMETRVQITDGKMNLRGNFVHRERPKYADYVLYFNHWTPIAIVEAKDANHSASYGLQQAMEYAKMMDVPFAFSSNGEEFVEHDFLTGKERHVQTDHFPTRDELITRYKAELHGGQGFQGEEERMVNQPYYTGQGVYEPRYYQRVAINKTVSAIAQGQNRLLLVMATGTGKTYTAFQIIYRLLKSGLKKKILYLADRNILVDQSIEQDFKPLQNVIHKINIATENPRTITSYQVYFALYQQLIGDDNKAHYKDLFRPDFFDLIIVDECHRGSAKDDSRWRAILEYFDGATQIGMTATPKETKYQSSISYFGEPVFKYSLKEGIDDGFLAPFKVVKITTNIGDEWRPTKGQQDIYGNLIEDRIYNNSDYDYNIIIEDRIREVAHEITQYLKSTDRMAKTIVFCADEDHAERMREALVNENSDMCRDNPDYVVRITGSDDYGRSKLDYFISVSQKYPVIATTSKLLSTGVDCKMTKLIVLDQVISSMTEFKQIIGRGTRLREKDGKKFFVVMDFRDVTRLFTDPDWDGPIEVDPNYPPNPNPVPPGEVCPICGQNPCICGTPPLPPLPPPTPKPIVDRDGCQVEVINKVVSVYDSDGKLLRTESIVDYTKRNIRDAYATLDRFILEWRQAEKKTEITEMLREHGIDIAAIKESKDMSDVDDFDFICYLAYGKKPLTRKERAEQVKKRDIFNRYGEEAKKVLEALLDKYMNEGITMLEDRTVLKMDPFRQMGSSSRIAQMFGGSQQYIAAVKELEELIYNVA